ncbi:hypothetical protein AB0M47_15985 [Hamadaea sp. NPDC051192]|uniref:hypothetical protein n=1 Tax=Hamadaea sp. NPDC051192 TaxID=3154940 RepID=UPI003431F9DE
MTPTASDVSNAEHVIRTHCPIEWPEARRCNNCHGRFPCKTHEWAWAVLTAAGRSENEILALDVRTGPWS